KRLGFRLSRTGRTFRITDTAGALAVKGKPGMSLAEIEVWISDIIRPGGKRRWRTRPRAAQIWGAVAAGEGRWGCATERRADTEYALEQFEESPEFDGTSERFDTLSKAVHKAREEERAAERAWRGAMERTEREVG